MVLLRCFFKRINYNKNDTFQFSFAVTGASLKKHKKNITSYLSSRKHTQLRRDSSDFPSLSVISIKRMRCDVYPSFLAVLIVSVGFLTRRCSRSVSHQAHCHFNLISLEIVEAIHPLPSRSSGLIPRCSQVRYIVSPRPGYAFGFPPGRMCLEHLTMVWMSHQMAT